MSVRTVQSALITKETNPMSWCQLLYSSPQGFSSLEDMLMIVSLIVLKNRRRYILPFYITFNTLGTTGLVLHLSSCTTHNETKSGSPLD